MSLNTVLLFLVFILNRCLFSLDSGIFQTLWSGVFFKQFFYVNQLWNILHQPFLPANRRAFPLHKNKILYLETQKIDKFT